MQAGKVGGAPHLGLEVAFSTPFRSAEGRTWQRVGGGKHRVSLSSLRRAGGSCWGSGVFARRKRSSRVLAPRGCSQLPRARAAWESWLLLAPAAGPSLPSTIYSQARWDASLLPSRRCGEQKPARAWGGSLQREQQGELQPCAPPGSLQAAGHIPAANPAPFSPLQPVFGGAGSAPHAKPSLARAAGARCQVRLAKQRQPGERMLCSAG